VGAGWMRVDIVDDKHNTKIHIWLWGREQKGKEPLGRFEFEFELISSSLLIAEEISLEAMCQIDLFCFNYHM
jgi:hypothetical protein